MFIPRHLFKKFLDYKTDLGRAYGRKVKEYHGNGVVVLDVGTNKVRVFDKDGNTYTTKISLTNSQKDIRDICNLGVH